ncbi:MAG: cytochrome c [Candidatus Latescibacteria bacterium]|nr:cytochrome c [Candidatus Latescibacterota bacterium]
MCRFVFRAALVLLGAAAGCGSDGGEVEEPAVRGRQVYLENGCNVCHGNEGHGDGPVARNLSPKPRNFADRAAYKRGPGLAEIEETISNGLSIGQGVMPAFTNIDPEDRRNLALYIQSLQSP